MSSLYSNQVLVEETERTAAGLATGISMKTEEQAAIYKYYRLHLRATYAGNFRNTGIQSILFALTRTLCIRVLCKLSGNLCLLLSSGDIAHGRGCRLMLYLNN